MLTHLQLHPAAAEVVPGDPASSVIIHVPHSASAVPADVRAGIELDDRQLQAATAQLVDWHTDRIARQAAEQCSPRPWLLINALSRYVIDPERLPGEQEPMSKHGMGAVYTRTPAGETVRSGADHDGLLERYFAPYAQQMEQLVADRLEAIGAATIIDLHSYPTVPMPHEDQNAARPAVCLGTDSAHTSAALLAAASAAFPQHEINTPFAGTYVPLTRWGSDPRVQSLMVEIRRDQYMHEPGPAPQWPAEPTDAELRANLLPGWTQIAEGLGALVTTLRA